MNTCNLCKRPYEYFYDHVETCPKLVAQFGKVKSKPTTKAVIKYDANGVALCAHCGVRPRVVGKHRARCKECQKLYPYYQMSRKQRAEQKAKRHT